ncbi:hypothetical protein BRC86_09015 [Halobacteriales archaeon QS_3_64_16]|nr:MAG: hypothetical protein BRC86_09015 [Halobacteriales archaeon QS_3_64_16]
MSDFDKEAEREKLREQFAADEEKREVTERMSNLLLQGATMTNTHCDTCSSPIFTYEGQAFCPTCQVEVDDAGGEGATAGAAKPEVDPADADRPDSTAGPEAGADSSTRIEVSDPGTSTDPQSSTPTESNASPEPSEPEPTRERRTPSPPESTEASDTAATPSPRAEPDSTAEPDRGRTGGAADTSSGDSDLTAAQASLSRTLTRLSEEAERSEDLSRTREHLLAAREAAEALAALREARR